MFSRKYYRYAIIALILIGWSSLIDSRNQYFPRVQNVVLQQDGAYHRVKCELWNPWDKVVHVAAHIRLVNEGDPESGQGVTATPVTIVKRRVGPQSRVIIEQTIKSFGVWPEAEVRLFVITDPEEIEQLAATEVIKNSLTQ